MLYKNGSYIKVGLVIVLHALLAVVDHVLRVEDDVLLLELLLVEEVELLVLGWVVVQPEEAVLHLQRYIVVLFDCHWRLLLHLAKHGRLRCLLFIPHEHMAHLFLFFSSILHRLQVPRESRRTARALHVIEGDSLDLVRRDVVQLLDLHLQVHRQIVFLLALPEGIGNQQLLLLRDSSLRHSSWVFGETGRKGVLEEGRALEAVHSGKQKIK